MRTRQNLHGGQTGLPSLCSSRLLFHDGRVFLGSQAPRRWHRNLSLNPKVAFEVDVYDRREEGVFDFRGLMIKGEAHVVKDSARRRQAIELLRERHPDAPFAENPIVVRIVPKKRYRWGPWDRIHED